MTIRSFKQLFRSLFIRTKMDVELDIILPTASVLQYIILYEGVVSETWFRRGCTNFQKTL